MPEELRPRMFAWLSTAWALPGVLGPAIAGIVGDTIGWRAVFLGLLPLIAVAAVATTPALRAVAPPPEAADAEAAAAASLRRRLPLALLVTARHRAVHRRDHHRRSGPARRRSGCPAGARGIYALRRLTPPGTLRAARGLPSAVLIRGLVTFGFFAVDAYVSRVLVDVRGMSLSQAGIVLTATTITWTTGSWVQAHWNNRWPLHTFVRSGMLIVAAGIATFMLVLIPGDPGVACRADLRPRGVRDGPELFPARADHAP